MYYVEMFLFLQLAFWFCCVFTAVALTMNALTMDVAALTIIDDNTEISLTAYNFARHTPPDDALDIKDCGCYTTIRKDVFDMSVMKLVYQKLYWLCTTGTKRKCQVRHFLFEKEA